MSVLDNAKEYNLKVLEAKNRQIDVQMAETVDTSPYNDKIKAVL